MAKFIAVNWKPRKKRSLLQAISFWLLTEVADLMMTAGKEIETPIAAWHKVGKSDRNSLVVQRRRPIGECWSQVHSKPFPSPDFPSVWLSKIDSRTILDTVERINDRNGRHGYFHMARRLPGFMLAFPRYTRSRAICDWIGEAKGIFDAYLLPEFEEKIAIAAWVKSIFLRRSTFDDAARLIVMHQQRQYRPWFSGKLKLWL